MAINETQSVREIWVRAFNQVRSTVDVATVWLAMQSAVPITIDGHYFVVGLLEGDEYLSGNLQNHEATSAIEDALQQITGRVLAFHLIKGTTRADWEAQRPAGSSQASAASATADHAHEQPAASASSAPQPGRPNTPPPDPAPSWEELGVRLAQGYKASPVKHAHGQARFVLRAARLVSDTMDALMPASAAPLDDAQERALAKTLERFGSIINLDPVFLALEVMRYRQAHGKETF